MNLAISNIAWGEKFDEEIISFLSKIGCAGLELAPDLLPWLSNSNQIKDKLKICNDYSIRIIGLHSLLFEHKELNISNRAHWGKIFDKLKRHAEICNILQGDFLLFGSGQSRICNDRYSKQDNFNIAKEFFINLSLLLEKNKIDILIEALPGENIIINNHYDAIKLLDQCNCDNLKLQCEIRTLWNNATPPELILKMKKRLQHIHTGGNNLSFIANDDCIKHSEYAKCIKSINYDKYITLEMVRTENFPNYKKIKNSIDYAKNEYFK
jgi:D-psicose/D-tagatose/L-ribulose 3-epimerase